MIDIQPNQITAPNAPVMASASPGATPLTVPPSTPPPTINHPKSGGPVLTTPAVRKIAKENSIDLQSVAGTGPKGRILKEDVLNYIKNGRKSTKPVISESSSPTLPSISSSSPITAVSSPKAGSTTVVPIRGIQRIMVKSMTAALQVPHLGYSEEIVMDSLISLRQQLKHALDKKGSPIKLSFMPFILKVTAFNLILTSTRRLLWLC